VTQPVLHVLPLQLPAQHVQISLWFQTHLVLVHFAILIHLPTQVKDPPVKHAHLLYLTVRTVSVLANASSAKLDFIWTYQHINVLTLVLKILAN
jgi:hypothetical protein